MRPHRQISVIEIAVILGAIVLVGAILLPAVGTTGTHCGSRQLKDATQVRAIQTAMIIWSQEHHSPSPEAADSSSPDQPVAADPQPR